MKKLRLIALCCAAAIFAGALSGCGTPAGGASPSDTPAASEPTESAHAVDTSKNITEYDGYSLIWHDEFSGTELNADNWTYEVHNPGYTNQELQEYSRSQENTFVRDGSLVIKATKTDRFGKDYYKSGKINNRVKGDFTYGKVVVSAKVPEGQGLWPAVWMMSTDSKYGEWPRSGEIDIMEILGHETNIAYTTIHYGDPHASQQGTLKLEEGSFSDGFHEFSVEWEPGEMRFYVDGINTLTCNDWFSASPGGEAKPYPAPFDQEFYLMINLAVGGTWPGNPDDSTDFDKAELLVDYVRIYQKPEYDLTVTRPEKQFRDPLEDGNYIFNGDFAEAEDLSDENNWSFMLFGGGNGTASISDNTLTVTTEDDGTLDYSLQLVQAGLPMIQGKTYRLSFDAASSETREFVVCVSGPNAGYIRYMPDTKVTVTPEWQTFTYEFTMAEQDDNNGRIEFNMGMTGSLADINLKNVRIECVN